MLIWCLTLLSRILNLLQERAPLIADPCGFYLARCIASCEVASLTYVAAAAFCF